MDRDFEGQVAVVTGAGAGLGRAHATALAKAGARVVVNDIAGPDGGPSAAAQAVVDEIEAVGGTAVAEPADVADRAQVAALVARVLSRWGRIDVLVSNAGILRDRSFARMEMADFDRVVAVHLTGTANICHAVWGAMRDQGAGRIVLTTSCSGLYGNFGQANYAAAKMGIVGLMKTLRQEGAKYDIRVNAIAPLAATGMTDGIIPDAEAALLVPEAVSPAVLFLASGAAPSGVIMGAGAGAYSVIEVVESAGVYLPPEARSPSDFARAFPRMSDMTGARTLETGFDQTGKFLATVAAAKNG
ncbi:SDR family NAD(P)-dependent oxidoreductase [Mesobaculum littorinae]|uniref:SDR family NAD(P)-dependent oxidoreductase n=1 Tax=Mesobaculum littorinae TaxID=2486419 RepID=A0A438AKC8_9RHOB|nr:SDR family NAD(P)-dependent oxidoreductase [Mesobaculum littorinae]RVV99168.1 SDR family NAD(P)-dependent oxidoreductase [Mesobaculum littorinae]